MNPKPSCHVDTCSRPSFAHGLCSFHYDREYKYAVRKGDGWDSIYVPAEPFRRRIREFMDAGYSSIMLEAITGIEQHTFQRQLSLERERALEYYVDKLNRTPLVPIWRLWRTDIGVDYRVPKYLVTRRARSLLAYGWETPDIMKASGLSSQGVLRIYQDDDGFAMRSTLVKMDKAFRELSMLPQPTHMRPSRVKKFRQWPVPFEWDDIDHPDDHIKAQKRAARRLSEGARRVRAEVA